MSMGGSSRAREDSVASSSIRPSERFERVIEARVCVPSGPRVVLIRYFRPSPPLSTRQVFVKAAELKAGECSEEDIGDLEKLISEATKAVDKAVGKGVLHGNTGARRKSRMSKYKQELRKEKGLYTA